MEYDLIIRGGTIVDGTGADRFVGDVAVQDGKVAAVGEVSGTAKREIDASGLIVAPGIIDLHTHYDAQLHWDPYCTASGWHGTTTCMIGNCGFGFAPVRPGMADRYMRMMENTEQVPYDVMKRTMSWDWQTFPQWLDHLRSLPKGLNIATYLPMNALLSYVVGPDEAKRRPATPEERAEMRRILHEAMDAGASGFAFSHLGAEGNSHVDYDQSPMPTDVMAPEEAYNLADVLRERGEGVMQVLVELPGMAHPRRDVVEELARRSGRPVLHNVIISNAEDPEQHRGLMRWLDELNAKGLKVWSQGFTFQKPLEINPMHYNNWDAIPVFRSISAAQSREDKIALVTSPAFRERFQREYDPSRMVEIGGGPDIYVLVEAHCDKFRPYEGKSVLEIAEALGEDFKLTFLDIMAESKMDALFLNPYAGSAVGEGVVEMLRHPRVLAGASDGGAHSKHGNGGFWSTDMIVRLTRDSNAMTLEEIHAILGSRNAEAACLTGRGSIKPGNFADMMIYDWETLHYDPPLRYELVHDQPGGDWRKVKRAVGIRHILVGGEITFNDGVETGATPGRIVQSDPRAVIRAVAAE